MGYIRTRDEALDAVAEIMELPERRTQIIRCTVGIMQCLEADPRAFMADCQALLIEGGLEALGVKRRNLLENMDESMPIVVLDPEEDKLFESLAAAFDALRLSEIVREVFREIAALRAPWEAARALIGSESKVQEQIRAALKARRVSNEDEYAIALRNIQKLIDSHRPSWHDQFGKIKKACLDVLTGAQKVPPAQLESETDLLSMLIAADDERAISFLQSIDRDPQAAVDTVTRIHELSISIRTLAKKASDMPTRVA